MFRGSAYLNLDAKGRFAIPTKQRERLLAVGDTNLILTVDRARCLLLFPVQTWELIERDLAALPAFDDAARSVQRLDLGNAEELEMDAQGRVLLPQHLREFAFLDKRIVLVGQGGGGRGYAGLDVVLCGHGVGLAAAEVVDAPVTDDGGEPATQAGTIPGPAAQQVVGLAAQA